MWPPDKLCTPSMLSATCAVALFCAGHRAQQNRLAAFVHGKLLT